VSSRRLSWGGRPDAPPPKRPYRDTVVVYAGLAVVIVVVSWLTGGGLGHAIAIASAFFVVATAYSSWQWRKRLAEEERRRAAESEGSG
jgi:membrane protein implicated in regulation of membrane protease activity